MSGAADAWLGPDVTLAAGSGAFCPALMLATWAIMGRRGSLAADRQRAAWRVSARRDGH